MSSGTHRLRPLKRSRNSQHDPAPYNGHLFTTIYPRSEHLVGAPSAPRTQRVALPEERPANPWLHTAPWGPADDPDYALDEDGTLYNSTLEQDIMMDNPEGTDESRDLEHAGVEKVVRRTRSAVARRPNIFWTRNHRQEYLEEIIRREGRGDFIDAVECPDCLARRKPTAGLAQYRCVDCFLPDLVCQSCCVKRHRVLPFHRVQMWTGALFQKTSLRTIGLRVQLNHSSLYCPNPIPCHGSMLVIHTSGVHSLAIDYCGCIRGLGIPQHVQLLRRGLYPATQLVPKTCATIDLLEHLHVLALTTKAATYDFYRALERMTAPIGVGTPESRYRTLFRMLMQWRHLKLLKRGGRAHAPGGAAATAQGELAILCPSCPRPGVNLPQGWEHVSGELMFLYSVILCMDANFRLKNQLVSNYSQDPGMGTGWAYMIPRVAYEAYVLNQAGEEDISTCVGLQALAKAYTKYCEGLRYTGVSAVSCGRSEMLLPTSVGNLQKGERQVLEHMYSNMDYTFGSSLSSVASALLVLISYDIACQWFVNLYKRMEHWPAEVKPTEGTKILPAIPKLHHSMHEHKGHEVYSLNYLRGVGNTDCECPERIWAPHNVLGNATKVQGPGTRHDYLDDHWGFWNWSKYMGMGDSMADRYKAAIADRNIQTEGHRGLTASLNPGSVKVWEKMCVDWEKAAFPKKDAENPFETSEESLTESEVRKSLAEEEESRLAAGGLAHHSTSASMFIVLALDLEESQRKLQRRAKLTTSKSTALKKSALTEQRNVLRSRIKAWELLLPIYIPGLLQYVTDLNNASSAPTSRSMKPEDAKLWLPSRIPVSHRAAICRAGLPAIEERLRSVQCTDALNSVRRILKMKSRMISFKNHNLVGQRDGTRSRSVIDRVHGRARASAAKYRAARVAKLSLSGHGPWELSLKELQDADVRGYQDPSQLKPRTGRRGVLEDELVEALGRTAREAQDVPDDINLLAQERTRRDGTGETRRTLSWIWTTPNTNLDDNTNDDVMRAEWAKSRARAQRAKEEVLILKEEMRRVEASLKWKADWWRQRANRRTGLTADLQEGLSAYAEDQALVQESLCKRFCALWANPLADNATSTEDVEEDDESEEDLEGGLDDEGSEDDN